MTSINQIYQRVRYLLYKRYSYPIDQIQPEIRFQIELAIDSLEMFEIMDEWEQEFNIHINMDDIDEYIFQPQDITHISDIKQLTIQDAVNYIEKQIKSQQ